MKKCIWKIWKVLDDLKSVCLIQKICPDNLKRVQMIKKYAWVIWISYKCTVWSIFGPLLCLKFANTLFTRICREFEK